MAPLERAARALFEEAHKQQSVPPFGYADADYGKTILDGAYDLKALVRAVLTAIREPSEGMVVAGGAGMDHEGATLSDELEERAAAAWQAMIDAALAEGK